MGILNVTPDSFSDGGRYLSVDTAISHGLRLAAAGADFVDVGGESTRPGCMRTSEVDERNRVLPVIRALTDRGVAVSIDTMRAGVAEAAVAAGASMINDVSGGLADPAMGSCVADLGVLYVAMHWRGHSAQMQTRSVYTDVVTTVCAELRQRIDALVDVGIGIDRIIADPGLGFAKTSSHNWALLRRLDELTVLGVPLMVGPSRKRFLADIVSEGRDDIAERDLATAAVSALAVSRGATWVRVHDVRSTITALRAAAAISGPSESTTAYAPAQRLINPTRQR